MKECLAEKVTPSIKLLLTVNENSFPQFNLFLYIIILSFNLCYGFSYSQITKQIIHLKLSSLVSCLNDDTFLRIMQKLDIVDVREIKDLR